MKNKFHLSSLIIFFALFPLTLSALDNSGSKPDFVFAVFATHRSRAELLEKAALQNVLAYNMNWNSKIDLDNKCVKNVWMRKNNDWVKIDKAPLPDVVYDFGVYKGQKDRKALANALKLELQNLKILFINPEDAMVAVNDKILFSTIMHKHGVPHPETLPYNEQNAKKMIAAHDLLFIKPTFGSKGHGIIIVTKMPNMQYSISYKTKKRGEWVKIVKDNIEQKKVIAFITDAQRNLGKLRVPYLIQQGIDAFRFKDTKNKQRQTDFRINTQRGLDGILRITGSGMRVGGNLSQGGRPALIQSVLKNSGLYIFEINERVQEVALHTHLALEQYTSKKIGDLGIDIVIKGPEPYVIEANHKNGFLHTYIDKNPDVDHLFGLPSAYAHCKKIDDQHETELLGYARYLAKERK